MKRWLKISALGLALLAFTGCSSANKRVEDSLGVTPTTQADDASNSENSNQEGNNADDNQVDSNQPTPEPQGDYAENVIIALDAGHGGIFTGATYDGRVEKELTLSMAFYVKEYLEENYTGFEVHLVREDDSVLSEDVKEDLELRAQFAKDVNADALVSLHFNASENHSQQGSMVLVSHRENVTESSKGLGTSILNELSALGLESSGNITRNSNDMFDELGNPLDYYAINRHSAARDIPGIIVEHCFMDNATDVQFLDSEADLRALAKADAMGIANYFGFAGK